jgi:2'-5' RNA ligase
MKDPRLLFVAMPPPDVVAVILEVLRKHGLDHLLGPALFAPSNWHQSLSGRIFNPSRTDIALLRGVGDRVSAHACTLQYNRIDGKANNEGSIHVTLHARGVPKAFTAILQALKLPLMDQGYGYLASNNSPHGTLSYRAPSLIDKIDIAPAIDWTIDHLLLVLGGGDPYRYEVIDRWALLPEIDPIITQTGLF